MSETEQHNVQQSVQQGAQENLGAHRDAHHTQQHGTQQHGAQPSPSVRFTNATVTRGHRVIWTDGNFSIPRGTVTAIVGTNGAGKTTLLDVELGLLHLSNGSVEVLGLPAGKANEKIGYVPQNYASDIDSNITAEQSVRLGLDGTRFGIHRMSDQQRDKITQALQLAGIENHRKLRLSEMSGGMRQRVAIAQALVSDPELLLLDEPLTSLDVVVAEEMKQLLRSLKQDRITIFSTHIMDLALDLCDEIVLLNHGELEVVEKTDLDSREFKDKIIAALREEENE